jgi:hypothetical protein
MCIQVQERGSNPIHQLNMLFPTPSWQSVPTSMALNLHKLQLLDSETWTKRAEKSEIQAWPISSNIWEIQYSKVQSKYSIFNQTSRFKQLNLLCDSWCKLNVEKVPPICCHWKEFQNRQLIDPYSRDLHDNYGICNPIVECQIWDPVVLVMWKAYIRWTCIPQQQR